MNLFQLINDSNTASSEAHLETSRIMQICNACRYCEGFCTVFPAMERRRTFEDGDTAFFAQSGW
ncbi:putative citrate utilization protein B (citB); putative membrane protein [Candidatus Puniceispirillum marinum IMCC1322]|uniref:Putative citrate utilization protein B (CitB) putative membrane protein n=1 Tax=Puniceispirillum marinum (strain IMCC1322) TaxID=488538 RepID=D5BQ64_PUNMI|nr:putative citrate utilization protein B (citB); putative membrane protein [Candidatus Puniceispirillum marinum IMCC1322]